MGFDFGNVPGTSCTAIAPHSSSSWAWAWAWPCVWKYSRPRTEETAAGS